MKRPPYTYTEAKFACEEFHYLIGKDYDHTDCTIDSIMIVPFAPADRSRFFMLYLMLDDAEQALNLDYGGPLYGVAVVSGSVHAKGMQHCELYDWLTQNGYTGNVVRNAAEDYSDAVS